MAPEPTSSAPQPESETIDAIEAGVARVCRDLAEQIVSDGEGVNRVMEIEIEGAVDGSVAERLADSIARSTLVKTALTGADPNWGRILSAAGNAGVEFDPTGATLTLGDDIVFENGEVRRCDPHRLERTFSEARVRVRLEVGDGPGRARMLTTDLSKRYVEINSEYTT